MLMASGRKEDQKSNGGVLLKEENGDKRRECEDKWKCRTRMTYPKQLGKKAREKKKTFSYFLLVYLFSMKPIYKKINFVQNLGV